MSTEYLTPKQIKAAAKDYGDSYDNFSESGKIIAAGNFHEGATWALSQVEHKTKQLREENEKLVYSNSVLGKAWHRINEENKRLREERDRAIQCIKISLYWLNEPIMPQTARSIMKRYIDKLNQENEG